MAVSQIGQVHIEPQIATRAAQYLRMSTEHQQYSTVNQADAIGRYADQHGLTIVRTYQDDGRSGLRLQDRPGLQLLLADAQNGVCDFKSVLVYDVSRWGRFQDVDESAYYEFICKEAGITIHYCAEQFTNDGSLLAALIKNIKRAMAAEFSRELSAKTFAGQCRLVRLGYWQGAAPGYALRRLLVNSGGKRKFVLKSGEQKSIITDRVILVRGPLKEVELIRRIYNLFVTDKYSLCGIARILNSEGKRRPNGLEWTHQHVSWVLKSEKYIGNNVFNRRSRKLHQKYVANPPEMWVRNVGCFERVVDAEIFQKAQNLILERKQARESDEYLLQCLRTILRQEGRLSRAIIDTRKLGPCAATYVRRFGSFAAAYKLIGYKPPTVPELLSRKNGKYVKLPRSAASKLNARNARRTREARARKRANRLARGLSR